MWPTSTGRWSNSGSVQHHRLNPSDPNPWSRSCLWMRPQPTRTIMEKAVDKETAKDHFRASRLSWSNQAEHRLRQELSDIAIANCRHITEKFAQCAKENGLMVVLRCRAQNRAMNDCMHQYTNDEQFAIYKEKREKEMLQDLE